MHSVHVDTLPSRTYRLYNERTGDGPLGFGQIADDLVQQLNKAHWF